MNIDAWERFDELVRALEDRKRWRKDTKQVQRLFSANNRMVDLVPCGDVAEDGAILWPPDRSHRMDVRGFELAISRCVELFVDDELSVSIAPLPVLALLKTISWWDRAQDNARDAQDLVRIARSFIDTEGETLLHREENLDLYELEDDHECRSAHLLGRTIREIADEETLALAVTIVGDGIDEEG